MHLLLLILLLLANFGIGYNCAVLLKVTSLPERVGLAFLLGSGLTSFLFFWTYAFFNFPFNAVNVFLIHVLPLVLIFIFIWLRQRSQMSFNLKVGNSKIKKYLSTVSKFSDLEKWLLFILLFLIIVSAFLNYVRPITDWDAIALYDFRAKVMTMTGSWSSGFDLGYFFQYPPYTSLLHAMIYALGIPQAKVWYSCLYFSFIVSFYALLRRKVNRLLSLVGALLLAISPLVLEHATVAYTNLAYTTFFVLSIIYLWYWLEQQHTSDLILGSLLLGLTTWVRMSEPFWVVGVVLIFSGLIGYKQQSLRQVLKVFYGFAIFSGIRIVWLQYLKYLGTILRTNGATNIPPPEAATTPMHVTVSAGSLLLKLTGIWGTYAIVLLKPLPILQLHIAQVLQYMTGYIFPAFSYLLFPVLLSCFLLFKHKNASLFLNFQILTMLLLLGMIFGGTLVFSFTFFTWDQIGGSANRMVMFLPPFFIFILMQSPLWQLHKK